jgi:hypothetical protein
MTVVVTHTYKHHREAVAQQLPEKNNSLLKINFNRLLIKQEPVLCKMKKIKGVVFDLDAQWPTHCHCASWLSGSP